MGVKLDKFSHYTFDSGENKGEAPTFFSKSELYSARNVENRGDGLETRYGCTVFNVNGSGYPSPIVANPTIMSIQAYTYGTSATYDTIYTGGTTIYRDLDSPSVIRTGLSANGARFQFEIAENIVHMTNGTDPVYFYQPSRSTTGVFTSGYDTPGVFNANAVGAGGSMAAGTYEYFVTWWDSETKTESNIQDAAVSVTTPGANSLVNLTNLPIDSESRTTHWNIYRKDPTGNYHYRVAQHPYNAGTPSYTDTAAVTGTTFIAPLDNNRPDPSTCICRHGKIMVYASGNTFTWSKYYRFQNVPTFNRETLSDNSFRIEKMVSDDGVLIIFKTESIYVVIGDLNGSYTVRQISKNVGTRSPMTVSLSPSSGLFFLDSRKKPRKLTATDYSLDDLREQTDISFKYRKKFDLIRYSDLPYCHAVIWETGAVSQWRLFVAIDTILSYPDHCYVFDYALERRNGGDSAWFDFKYNLSVACSTAAIGDGGEFQLQAGDNYGLLWKLDVANVFYDGDEYRRAEGDGTVTFGVNTVTVSTANNAVDQFVGLQLIIYNRYSYQELFRSRVTANTATQFTLQDNLPTLPTDDPFLTVGGYLTYFATAQYTHDRAGRFRPFKVSALFSRKYAETDVQFFTHYDFNDAFNYTYDYINNPSNPSLTPLTDNYTISVGESGPTYDAATSLYDTSRYGLSLYGTTEFRLNSKYLPTHVSWGVITREPSSPFGYLGASLFYQFKRLTTRST